MRSVEDLRIDRDTERARRERSEARKIRACLRCDAEFSSSGPSNRLCKSCRQITDYATPCVAHVP